MNRTSRTSDDGACVGMFVAATFMYFLIDRRDRSVDLHHGVQGKAARVSEAGLRSTPHRAVEPDPGCGV